MVDNPVISLSNRPMSHAVGQDWQPLLYQQIDAVAQECHRHWHFNDRLLPW